MMFIAVEPMGAVRMTRRGKYMSDTAQRYLNYKTEVQLRLKRLIEQGPAVNPVSVDITFYMPIPNSWSKKKKEEAAQGKLHTSKPDIDNMVKGFFDAANGIMWTDDKNVVQVNASKQYGVNPGIQFSFKEL